MKKRTARLTVAAAAIAAIAPLSGCANMLSADQTANYEYHGGDGAWSREDLEGVDIRGLLLLQSEEGDAQVFYTVINGADEPRDVTLEVGPETYNHTVEPDEVVSQNPENPASDAEPAIISGLDEEVGSLFDVEVTVGSESETIAVQVLDGSLPEYADLVPTSGAEEPTTDPTEEGAAAEGAEGTEGAATAGG
ncbi:MAG: hypothetical protein ACTHVY_04380 [Brevibacterium yomogidense]|uniref:DNA modification methylase n=1 Tax=Brevibacterium yomogidense TaxID=946573 RepID=A0A1X6XN76_9MICO|nr:MULTISPECIES: hypothetical protein [Brevibacterium]SLN00588.1 hypothetical protein FM105_13020 [Brevibacterium yomogidense]SMX73035.1 hypothetical protein BSP109_00977 [Brevibacterium sp. Mu109]